MNETEFRQYLKRGGRAPNVAERCVRQVSAFEDYLHTHYPHASVETATPAMLENYVAWVEDKPKTSAKNHLWALRYYFDFNGNSEMKAHAGELRQARIKRKPFLLGKFRGMDKEHANKLAARGIKNVKQMLTAGRTPQQRQALAEQTGIPPEAVLEFVKLSDLARLGGVREVRARLYHDAGLLPENIGAWEPEELRTMLAAFVEQTGFDGIAPLPKEAQHLVNDARKLPKVVEY